MARIKIRNFGPIRSGLTDGDGWIHINKTTIFIGNQGSGKSTVSKLISTMSWMEKALVRGDFSDRWFKANNRFSSVLLKYHRLDEYSYPESEVIYQGDAYNISYIKSELTIEKSSASAEYNLPQIAYIPAERSFLSYVRNPRELKLTSPSLQEFLSEYENAKEYLQGEVELPVNDAVLEYDKLNDLISIKGEGYKVKLLNASSGYQSLVPLYLVTSYLSESIAYDEGPRAQRSKSEEDRFNKELKEILSNSALSKDQKSKALSLIGRKYTKQSFINIVEEPEQNLFPTSQWGMLTSLLKANNRLPGNKLVLTTHSPYMINDLTALVKGQLILLKAESAGLLHELNCIVPVDALIKADDLSIYELDENEGSLSRLDDYRGLPSDENYLNEILEEGNQRFSLLMDLEEKCL